MAPQKYEITSPVFQAAFTRLEATVSREHARSFQNTDLRDVWSAIKDIEAQMAARQSLRGLRRVEPFLKGIEQYSKVVEFLCNSTPYLSWLWVFYLFQWLQMELVILMTNAQAPIKLFIQVDLPVVSFNMKSQTL